MLSIGIVNYIEIGTKLVNKDSIRTALKLGPPMLEFSTKSQNFMSPMILNTNFIKRESEIHITQAAVPLIENPQT